MNTSKKNNGVENALQNVPKNFRVKILKSYFELKNRYANAKYNNSFDASGLSSGKFVESILRFLQHSLTNTFVPFGTHIPNFPDECRKLIQLPASAGNESLRIIIPRALVFLYTLRGKRGIGHIGGDIEANEIDASTVVKNCDWIICELIRIYHSLSIEEAQALIDSLAEKELPDIWEISGKKRVLRNDLSYKQKVLILLYSEQDKGILSEDLFDWSKHTNYAIFKSRILNQLHSENLIEYDRENEIVYLSPLGINEVETSILSKNVT